MDGDSVLHCLLELASYDSADIESDDIEIAVNCDQRCTVSIVHLAKLSAQLIEKQSDQIKILREGLVDIRDQTKNGFATCSRCGSEEPTEHHDVLWMAELALKESE